MLVLLGVAVLVLVAGVVVAVVVVMVIMGVVVEGARREDYNSEREVPGDRQPRHMGMRQMSKG